MMTDWWNYILLSLDIYLALPGALTQQIGGSGFGNIVLEIWRCPIQMEASKYPFSIFKDKKEDIGNYNTFRFTFVVGKIMDTNIPGVIEKHWKTAHPLIKDNMGSQSKNHALLIYIFLMECLSIY